MAKQQLLLVTSAHSRAEAGNSKDCQWIVRPVDREIVPHRKYDRDETGIALSWRDKPGSQFLGGILVKVGSRFEVGSWFGWDIVIAPPARQWRFALLFDKWTSWPGKNLGHMFILSKHHTESTAHLFIIIIPISP
jgi:hypothetical protein